MTAARVFAVLVVSVSAVSAAPEEAVILAAMQVGNEPNYSWTTVVRDDVRSYAIEGRTERGGLTWQRQPMPAAIAKRLGRDADMNLEAFFRNSAEFVVQTGLGWKRLSELPKIHPDWRAEDEPSEVAVPLRMPSWRHEVDPPIGPWEDNPVVYVPMPRRKEVGDGSNYQFGLARPHDELEIIVSSFGNLRIEEGTATGTLSDVGAQLLLVRAGQEGIRPLSANGMFKLWVTDGRVVKYAVELAGTVLRHGRAARAHQVSFTLLMKFGATDVSAPSEVRRKLP